MAQQILDTSPQTAHPRKEKKGGGGGGGGVHPLQQVFRSLIPGSRYWLPPQDVMVFCINYNVLSLFSVPQSHI